MFVQVYTAGCLDVGILDVDITCPRMISMSMLFKDCMPYLLEDMFWIEEAIDGRDV